MGKIINNLIDIVEMGSSMLWSDIKMISRDIMKVIKVETITSVESVENDKLSNGISDEEKEARERQLYMMEVYDFSEFTSETFSRDAMRDENGFPIDLKSKLRNDKND